MRNQYSVINPTLKIHVKPSTPSIQPRGILKDNSALTDWPVYRP